MGLETATYIHELDSSNPVGASDPKGQGDDHLKLIKSTLQNTFPNVEGEMTASHTELNKLDGATVTTEQLNALGALLTALAGIKIAFCTGNASASPSGGNFVDTTKANLNCTGTHTNSSGMYTMDYTAAGFTNIPAVFVLANNPNRSAGTLFKRFESLPTLTSALYSFENLSNVLSDTTHFFLAIGD